MTFLEATRGPKPAPTTQLGQMPGLPGVTGTNAYGYIPQVPDLSGSMGAAIQGNLANWGGIADLIRQFSEATTAAAQVPYNQALPGWQGGMTTGLGNAMDFMQGKIPTADLTNMIQNTLSNRFARGINPGSPASNAAIVQQILGGELGLNQAGASQFATLMGLVPKGAQMDPSSMLITPEQYQNWAWLSSLMRAAPDPTLAREQEMRSLNSGLGTYNRGPTMSLADQMAANYLRGGGGGGSPFMTSKGGGFAGSAGGIPPSTTGGGASILGFDEYGNEVSWNPDVFWNGVNYANPWGESGLDLSGGDTSYDDYAAYDPTYGWEDYYSDIPYYDTGGYDESALDLMTF